MIEEDDRRQPERVGGDEPQRVVDRRADVAVGGREQRARAEHPSQAVLGQACHAAQRIDGRARTRALRRRRPRPAEGFANAKSHAPQPAEQEPTV